MGARYVDQFQKPRIGDDSRGTSSNLEKKDMNIHTLAGLEPKVSGSSSDVRNMTSTALRVIISLNIFHTFHHEYKLKLFPYFLG